MSIDPHIHYCTCGVTFHPKLYHKLWMLLCGEYVRRCSNCGTIITYKMIGHVVKVDTKAVKREVNYGNS